MKIVKTTSIHEKHTCHISKEIKAVYDFKNGKLISKDLIYTGPKLYGYSLSPVYKLDIKNLKNYNPFTSNNWEMGIDIPDDPELISLDDIIYCQSASHSFFNLDKTPIPMVYDARYFNNGYFNNKYYKLKELREYLQSHPNVIEVSEILDIPYYNAECNCNKYLNVKIYPEVEWLIDKYTNKRCLSYISGEPWDKNSPDYLGTKKFIKKLEKDV